MLLKVQTIVIWLHGNKRNNHALLIDLPIYSQSRTLAKYQKINKRNKESSDQCLKNILKIDINQTIEKLISCQTIMNESYCHNKQHHNLNLSSIIQIEFQNPKINWNALNQLSLVLSISMTQTQMTSSKMLLADGRNKNMIYLSKVSIR